MATLPTALQQAVARMKKNPVQLTWDADGTPVQFYPESADITFVSGRTASTHPIVGPYDEYVAEEQITVAITIDEESANAFKALASQSYASSSTAQGFGSVAGTSLRTTAKKVEIRPYVDRAAETTKLEIWLAIVDGDISKAMGKEDGSFTVTLKSLADETKPDGMLHGRFTAPVRA